MYESNSIISLIRKYLGDEGRVESNSYILTFILSCLHIWKFGFFGRAIFIIEISAVLIFYFIISYTLLFMICKILSKNEKKR